ncbi:MAG: Coenzyme F420 hydrogenase/dehydrogenase, beta subunit C-terminal domain, partial [Oscillospiraceae bacterium]|nr:Coenzyme F420 hydrogenase/dehydrogenase, beta subunit C-terminal domain [Oscillospiraceae bacterium]
MPNVFVCQSGDDALLRESSSGGVFTHLARSVLSRGGAVFGAAFIGGQCRHICARTEEELAPLRGSKYLQSELGDTFGQAKTLLEQGTPVLFSGTPCQIAALAATFGHPNLTTLDLVCHGVPERKAWEAYAARFPAPPVSASFRDKTEGWRRFSVRFTFPGGTEYRKNLTEDPFMRAYLANLCLRKACHQCKFNTSAKKADITLGDDWGGLLPNTGDKGASVVLLHTPKGEALFETVRNAVRAEKTQFAALTAANQVL